MSQKNRQHRQRKSSYKRYFFLAELFFLAALSVSAFLGAALRKSAKKEGIVEVKKTILETAENHSSMQDAESEEPWNLMLVNNKNPIPDSYDVNLAAVDGGECVDERIYEPLMQMLEDAREGNGGERPMVVSGYRTQETQQSLYDEKIAAFQMQGYSESEAVEQAKQWVSVPGYSEHQLGFAVDINGAVYDVYTWLQENSYKYGFIFRYPGRKTEITGVAEEVWHYRYVGVEAAKEIYERGICLEEYLSEQN